MKIGQRALACGGGVGAAKRASATHGITPFCFKQDPTNHNLRHYLDAAQSCFGSWDPATSLKGRGKQNNTDATYIICKNEYGSYHKYNRATIVSIHIAEEMASA